MRMSLASAIWRAGRHRFLLDRAPLRATGSVAGSAAQRGAAQPVLHAAIRRCEDRRLRPGGDQGRRPEDHLGDASYGHRGRERQLQYRADGTGSRRAHAGSKPRSPAGQFCPAHKRRRRIYPFQIREAPLLHRPICGGRQSSPRARVQRLLLFSSTSSKKPGSIPTRTSPSATFRCRPTSSLPISSRARSLRRRLSR